jgi:hypothetical protein
MGDKQSFLLLTTELRETANRVAAECGVHPVDNESLTILEQPAGLCLIEPYRYAALRG